MTDRTYTDLYALFSALTGVDSFDSTEQTKILSLINRRIYQAYRLSDSWPRYLVSGQARPAPSGVIAYTYDDASGVRSVSSATRSGTTVTFTATADIDFVAGMTVTVASLSGSVDPNGAYTVASVDGAAFTYELDSGTGTETYTGSGTATPATIADIDTFVRVFDTKPLQTTGVREYEFYTDSDGAHVIGNTSSYAGFYVSYKKIWGGPYTTASTDIPQEFYHYAAHGAYADWLRMDGQTDKAIVEEQVAQQYLVVELDNAMHNRNVNLVQRRITTHASRQYR